MHPHSHTWSPSLPSFLFALTEDSPASDKDRQLDGEEAPSSSRRTGGGDYDNDGDDDDDANDGKGNIKGSVKGTRWGGGGSRGGSSRKSKDPKASSSNKKDVPSYALDLVSATPALSS